jgi:hypothetical protein
MKIFYIMLSIILKLLFFIPTEIINWEAGMRAYSKGRAYHAEDGFHLNEEADGRPGKRVIAWWPVKTKYGWIWLDYYWKYD